MAENELSTVAQNSKDNAVKNTESYKKKTNSLLSRSTDDNKIEPKSTILSKIRQKFSPKKMFKVKLTNEHTTTVVSENSQVDPSKIASRSAGFQLSFGMNVTNKDTEINKSESQNQPCPPQTHIANSHPPRNGLLASFGWYWGPLTRSEATQRLRYQMDGCFLVRDSEGDPSKVTLSFKGDGQIFHNRILCHKNKYAFLKDEEFDSIPDLISDAMDQSAKSTYCFSCSTDAAPTSPASTNNNSGHPFDTTVVNDKVGVLKKHEVRLMKPISRFVDTPPSLYYLCRFMIRQYTRLQDLSQLIVNPDILIYLEDPRYYI